MTNTPPMIAKAREVAELLAWLGDMAEYEEDEIDEPLREVRYRRTAGLIERLSSEKAALEGALAEADSKNDAMLHEWNKAETSARAAREALEAIVTCGCADEQLHAIRAALDGIPGKSNKD